MGQQNLKRNIETMDHQYQETPRPADYEKQLAEHREKQIREQRLKDRKRMEEKEYQEIRPFANQEERQRMKEANPHLINQMKSFLDGLKSMKKEKAIEIACGQCHVTRDLLRNEFFQIDLMD